MRLCYVSHLSAIVGDKRAYLIRLLESKPDRLVLRAKHFTEEEYERFLIALIPHAEKNNVELVVNHHPKLAKKYHLSLQVSFHKIEEALQVLNFGVSVHSLKEAERAKEQGAQWLVFGHLFPTASKLGFAPREMSELKAIIDLGIPTYGIGGIKLERLTRLPKGLTGVSIMRESMIQKNPVAYTNAWRSALKPLEAQG